MVQELWLLGDYVCSNIRRNSSGSLLSEILIFLLLSFLPGQLPMGVGGGAGRVWPERGSKAGVGGGGVARQTQTTVTKV